MKVLVTGGCGFIGSHVVDLLLDKGYEIQVLSRPNCDMGNLGHVKDDIDFLTADLVDFQKLNKLVDSDLDGILHFAALINVDQSIENPTIFLDTNVKGTFNILEVARQKQIPRLLYMSTCEVYGNVETGKADENYPTNPCSPYAVSKLVAEKYAMAYSYSYPKPAVTIIRGFNQYGPRQSAGKYGAVIPKFITRILNRGNIEIFGSGEQMRDYVFVKDTALGIVGAFEKNLQSGETINLATGIPISINEMAGKICEIIGKPESYIKHVAGRSGELMRSCGDYSKAKKILKWSPKTSFDDGLKETFNWFNSHSSS